MNKRRNLLQPLALARYFSVEKRASKAHIRRLISLIAMKFNVLRWSDPELIELQADALDELPIDGDVGADRLVELAGRARCRRQVDIGEARADVG